MLRAAASRSTATKFRFYVNASVLSRPITSSRLITVSLLPLPPSPLLFVAAGSLSLSYRAGCLRPSPLLSPARGSPSGRAKRNASRGSYTRARARARTIIRSFDDSSVTRSDTRSPRESPARRFLNFQISIESGRPGTKRGGGGKRGTDAAFPAEMGSAICAMLNRSVTFVGGRSKRKGSSGDALAPNA